MASKVEVDGLAGTAPSCELDCVIEIYALLKSLLKFICSFPVAVSEMLDTLKLS